MWKSVKRGLTGYSLQSEVVRGTTQMILGKYMFCLGFTSLIIHAKNGMMSHRGEVNNIPTFIWFFYSNLHQDYNVIPFILFLGDTDKLRFSVNYSHYIRSSYCLPESRPITHMTSNASRSAHSPTDTKHNKKTERDSGLMFGKH